LPRTRAREGYERTDFQGTSNTDSGEEFESTPEALTDQPDPATLREAFELNPGLRDDWLDAKAYREVFATPAEARAATTMLNDLNRMDALFFSKRPEDHAELARVVAQLDPAAFASLARAMAVWCLARPIHPQWERARPRELNLGAREIGAGWIRRRQITKEQMANWDIRSKYKRKRVGNRSMTFRRLKMSLRPSVLPLRRHNSFIRRMLLRWRAYLMPLKRRLSGCCLKG
jgi:hypothetical protein